MIVYCFITNKSRHLMKKLICIVGQKRAGKDTIAKLIKANHDQKSSVGDFAFADLVKHALHEGYSELKSQKKITLELTRGHWDGWETKTKEYDRETPLILNNQDVIGIFDGAIKYLAENRGLRMRYSWINSQSWKEYRDILLTNTKIWNMRRLLQVFGTDVVVDCIDKHFWVEQLIGDCIRSTTNINIVKDVRQTHEIETMRNLGAIFIHVRRPNLNNTDEHISERLLPIEENDFIIENDGDLDDLQQKVISFLKSQGI